MAALGGAAATALVAAGSASAAPTGDYKNFEHCPTGDPTVQSCLNVNVTGGNFKLGSAQVPITKSIRLQGGYGLDFSTDPFTTTWSNAVGADSLQKVPLDVPGGLTGLVPPSQLQNTPVLGTLISAINSVNKVTATAELVGPVGFNFINATLGSGTAMELPLRIKLDNPFLGSQCYIGSASDPVRLKLTAGTTAPPPPATPLTGTLGTTEFFNFGDYITSKGFRLVDNAFRAPAARDCGPLGFRFLITPVVNATRQLPAAAGKNEAILSGDLEIGSPCW
jgi:hypothetical protein